jgi:hypothetical protein
MTYGDKWLSKYCFALVRIVWTIRALSEAVANFFKTSSSP